MAGFVFCSYLQTVRVLQKVGFLSIEKQEVFYWLRTVGAIRTWISLQEELMSVPVL